MDKVLLRVHRLSLRNSSPWQKALQSRRGFCKSPHSATSGEGGHKYKGLDQDTSWEAAVLRHEKLVDQLRKEGVDPGDSPELERELKVKDLPHLSFREKSKFEKDESLLDETSKLMLGSLPERKQIAISDEKHTNVDPNFVRKDVQEVLQRIHYSCDPDKAYKLHITKRNVMPTVKYLTEEQLQQERIKIKEEMLEKLKMPLVMLQRKPCAEILSEDDVLDGYEESNVSFVDISEGLSNRERFIVMREPNGVLRKAEWEERDRLLQTYYPVLERTIIPASFFDQDKIKNVFEHRLHENALDQCIIQFEPDSKQYIQTFEAIYQDINKTQSYDLLRSTRYFGGLVYFLAKSFSLDGIIVDMLNRDKYENASDCVKLLTMLHPNCKTRAGIEGLSADDHISIVKAYIDNDSADKKLLSMALQRKDSSPDATADSM